MELNFTFRFYGNDQELEKIIKDQKDHETYANKLADIVFEDLEDLEFEARILDYKIGINSSDLKSKSYVDFNLDMRVDAIFVDEEDADYLIENVITRICDYYGYNYKINKFSYSVFSDHRDLPTKINFYYPKDKKTYSFYPIDPDNPIDFYDYINKEFSYLSNQYLDFEKMFFFIKSKPIEEVKDTYKTFSPEQLQNFDEWFDIFFDDREFIIDSFIPWLFDQAETYEAKITDKENLNEGAKILKDSWFKAYSCKIKVES